MKQNIEIPCSDPQCKDGIITVYNAYNKDPFVGESQVCDICSGRGFNLASEEVVQVSN